MLRAHSAPRAIPTKYLFVDGGYLDEVLQRFSTAFYGGQALAINYQMVGFDFSKVFYYHCPPAEADPPEQHERYWAHIRELEDIPGWHVSHGVLKRTRGQRGQKEVDVQLSVDLLTHSFRGNMDAVTLLTGDQDFRPAVEAVVREGMYLTLWCDRWKTSEELRSAADDRRLFDPWIINGLLRDPAQRCEVPEQYRVGHPTATDPGQTLEAAHTERGRHFVLHRRADTGAHEIVTQHREANGHVVYRHQQRDFLKSFVETLYGGALQWAPVT